MHAFCRRPEKTLMTAYGLCQQMMHVFHQLRLYVTFEVMEPAWIGMQAALDKAHTLDQVIIPASMMIISTFCFNVTL